MLDDGVEMSIPMRDGIDRNLAARLRKVAWAVMGVCAVSSVLVLIGWMLEIPALRKPIEDQAAVQSSIAITYLLCICSLVLVKRPQPQLKWAGRGLGVLVALVGTVNFIQQAFHLDFDIKLIHLFESPDVAGISFPGPMYPDQALVFFIMGIGLALFGVMLKGKYPIDQILMGVAGVISVRVIIGYAFGAQLLCDALFGCIRLPLISSFLSLLLCLSILFVEPERGFLGFTCYSNTVGTLVRRLLILLISVPAIALLCNSGVRANLYNSETSWTFIGIGVVGVIIGLIASSAKTLAKVESARFEAEEQLKLSTNMKRLADTGVAAGDGAATSASLGITGMVERKKFRQLCLTCNAEFDGSYQACPVDGSPLARLTEDTLEGGVFADRYEIVARLGGGGMSTVYKARHMHMDKIVAIKVLQTNVGNTAESIKRFQLEAKATSKLEHPNVISIFDFGVSEDGRPYMVMEYLEGISLSDLLDKKGKLPVSGLKEIFVPVCEGLTHAHQNGIIHRDLKPGNIMLARTQSGGVNVKIVDFGLAKLVNSEQKLTQTGETFGSPLYMSPEQCLGKQLDQRADIYSLGCVLFECITGQPPFIGASVIDTFNKHLRDNPPPFPPDLRVPNQVQQLIYCCLAKDKNGRPASAQDLIATLSL